MSKSMFHLMRVRQKQQRLTLSTPLTIAGRTVLTKPIIWCWQAFAPGEVSYEEAHRIGKELADKVLEGKYSYVVTTHIDKGHIHNHIIFCAADNIEHNKYHDCKQSYYHIRKLSDELCKAHNLSIIIPGGERGKNTKNGSLIRMALLGKPSLEGTLIFASSQLPHTKIFYF